MIKNIIFDWSGTLFDDFELCHKANSKVLEHFGGKRLSLAEFRKEFVIPYMIFYNKHIPGVKKEDIGKIYKENFEKLESTPFKGVKETLDFLHRNNINMIILSSSLKEPMIRDLRRYKIYDYFSDIKANLPDKKTGLIEIMDSKKYKKPETVIIGDMTYDIDIGKEIGIKTIAVIWGYQPRGKLILSKPDIILDDFEDLKELIENENK